MKQLNWNKIKAVSLIIGMLGFLSFGFQNCSKVGVEDLGSPSDASKLDNNCVDCGGSGDLPDRPRTNGGNGGNSKQPVNEEAAVVAQCLQQEGLLLTGPDIIDVRSSVTVTSDDINLISIISGSLKFIGKSPEAKGGIIEHVSSSVLLCGVDVEHVDDVGGTLTLVNSRVGNITRIKGSVRLFNSHADKIHDVGSSVSKHGESSVGSVSEVKGSIR